MGQSHVDYLVASFWLHRHVWSVIPQNFRYGQGSYVLGSCVNILLVCEARMRPDLNRHDWNMRRNNLRFLHRTTIAETLLSWTAFHMCVCVICVCVHRSFYKPKKVRTVYRETFAENLVEKRFSLIAHWCHQKMPRSQIHGENFFE